jgi:hypothetical protein
MLEYVMFMHVVRKYMDIRISSGFVFGATSMPWILSWVGQSKADGFGHRSGFGISIQTRSINILVFAKTMYI